jgi:uncharacterized protein YuzE
MKISYDPEVDALSIRLHEGRVSDSEQVSDGVIVDYDAEDRVIGVEVLSLRKRRKSIDVPDLGSTAVAPEKP